jgi:hypothetical protein
MRGDRLGRPPGALLPRARRSKMKAPTCDVRAMVLAVPIIPLAFQPIAFCRGVSRVGRLALLVP